MVYSLTISPYVDDRILAHVEVPRPVSDTPSLVSPQGYIGVILDIPPLNHSILRFQDVPQVETWRDEHCVGVSYKGTELIVPYADMATSCNLYGNMLSDFIPILSDSLHYHMHAAVDKRGWNVYASWRISNTEVMMCLSSQTLSIMGRSGNSRETIAVPIDEDNIDSVKKFIDLVCA